MTILTDIDPKDKLILGGDLNGHVGSATDGFEGVHGGFGFGRRNMEGEMLLEMADGLQLTVVNTWFKKTEAQLVTYESGGCRTVVDYFLVRQHDRAMVRNVKVAQNEPCIPQHKLVVCELEVRHSKESKREHFVSKCKVWKLRVDETRKQFQDKVQGRLEARNETGVEGQWQCMKDCLLTVADEVCGRTKGPRKGKESSN